MNDAFLCADTTTTSVHKPVQREATRAVLGGLTVVSFALAAAAAASRAVSGLVGAASRPPHAAAAQAYAVGHAALLRRVDDAVIFALACGDALCVFAAL